MEPNFWTHDHPRNTPPVRKGGFAFLVLQAKLHQSGAFGHDHTWRRKKNCWKNYVRILLCDSASILADPSRNQATSGNQVPKNGTIRIFLHRLPKRPFCDMAPGLAGGQRWQGIVLVLIGTLGHWSLHPPADSTGVSWVDTCRRGRRKPGMEPSKMLKLIQFWTKNLLGLSEIHQLLLLFLGSCWFGENIPSGFERSGRDIPLALQRVPWVVWDWSKPLANGTGDIYVPPGNVTLRWNAMDNCNFQWENMGWSSPTKLLVHIHAMRKLGSSPISSEDFCVHRLWGDSWKKRGISVGSSPIGDEGFAQGEARLN